MTTTNPAPARPSQMTVAEHQELDRFGAQAATASTCTSRTLRPSLFRRRDAGARRKAAFEAQLNHEHSP